MIPPSIRDILKSTEFCEKATVQGLRFFHAKFGFVSTLDELSPVGLSHGTLLCVHNKDSTRILVSKKNDAEIKKRFIDLLKHHPTFLKNHKEKLTECLTKALKVALGAYHSDLRKKSNKELFSLYKKFSKQLVEVYNNTYLHFALDIEDLKEEAKKILARSGDEDHLETLSAPSGEDHLTKYEKRLLELVKYINEAKLRFLFEKNTEERGIRKHPVLYEKIREVLEDYAWLPYLYTGPAWKIREVISNIQEYLKKDPEHELREIEREKAENNAAKSRIHDELELNAEEKRLVKSISEIESLKKLHREYLSMSYYYSEKLFKEIAGRTGASFDGLTMMLGEEVKDALLKGKLPQDLVKRSEKSVLVFFNGEQKVYTDGDYDEIKEITRYEGIQHDNSSPEDKFKFFNMDIDVSFLTVEMTARGMHDPGVKDIIGMEAPLIVIHIQDSRNQRYYMKQSEVKRFCKTSADNLLKNPELVSFLKKELERASKGLVEFAAKHVDRVESYDNPGLAQIFKEAIKLQQECAKYGAAPAYADIQGGVSKEVDNIFKKRKLQRPRYEYDILMKPETPTEKAYEDIRKRKDDDQLLKEYFWLDQGYIGTGLTQEFINEIRGVKPKKTEVDEQALLGELNLSTEEKRILELSKDLVHMKALRGDARQAIHVLLNRIAEKLSNEWKIPREEIEVLSGDEVISVLEGKRGVPSRLSERLKDCIVIWDGKKYDFLTGKDAKEWLERYYEEDKAEESDEVKGQPAYPGKATGKAKLVLKPEDMHKVQEGDILIAGDTSPQLLPAMKRAAAFVTDVGGITSHAAIVAREMRKPCIVGTVVATKTFKDGDLVEVDADQGIVIRVGGKIFVLNAQRQIDLFFMSCVLKCYRDHYAHFIGTRFTKQVVHGKKDYIAQYRPKDETLQIKEHLREKVKDDEFLVDNLERVEEAYTKFEDFIEDLKKKKPDRRKIKQIFKKLPDVYAGFLASISSTILAAEMLGERIQAEIKLESYDEVFTPDQQLIVTEEQLSMYDIIEKVREKGLSDMTFADKSIKGMIRKHLSKYNWVYSYTNGKIMDKNDVMQRIKDGDLSKIEENRQKLKGIQIRTDAKVEEILDVLPSNHQKLIRLIRRYLYFRIKGESLMGLVNLSSRELFQKIKKLYNIKWDIKNLSFSEIQELLYGKKFDAEIAERENGYVLKYWDDKIEVLTGSSADEFFSTLNIEEEKTEAADEIRGQTAVRGRVQGRAKKILDLSDLEKVQKGDILVAASTTPPMVIAMEKSAAIVTDEGGITCHAAIVSRELGVPCIVGTRVATKVLEDNDFIEVDADNGKVRVIERASDQEKWKVIAEDSAQIFPVYLAFEGLAKYTQEMIGFQAKYNGMTAKNSIWKYIVKMSEWEKASEITLNKLRDKEYFRLSSKKVLDKGNEVLDFCDNLENIGLAGLSNEGLLSLFEEYRKIIQAFWAWGWTGNWADFENFKLSTKIRDFLSKKAGKISEVFTTLVASPKDTYLKMEEREIYKIVNFIQENKLQDFVPERYEENAELKNMIMELWGRFRWMGFGFKGPDTPLSDYVDRIASLVRQDIDPQKELQRMQKEEQEILAAQDKLTKQLKLSEEEKHWLEVARMTTFLKGYRKDIMYMSFSTMEKWFDELERRMRLEKKILKNMTYHEIKDFILENKVNLAEMHDRLEHYTITIEDNGIKVLSGEESRNFEKNETYEEKPDENLKELHGQVACVGKAKGTVKILKEAQDMAKFNDGDILVSPATNPNLVPAMKRAGAIVTDEGGLTCHAAIVSRELGVPCVIGTRVATKALKDGDYVEVDAEKGVVLIKGTEDKFIEMSQRTRVSPFPNYLSFEVMTNDLKKYAGVKWSKLAIVYENNHHYGYVPEQEWKKIMQEVLQKILNDPALVYRLVGKAQQFGPKLVKSAKNASKNAKKATNKELHEYYEMYTKLYKPLYAVYGLTWIVDTPFAEYLKELFSGKGLTEQQFTDLIVSEKAVFFEKAELELLEIAKGMDGRTKKKLLKEDIRRTELFRKIKKHHAKYFWLPHDYEDPDYTVEDFVMQIKKHVEEGTLEKRRKELIEKHTDIIRKREKAEKELSLNDEEKGLFQVLREFIFLKECRKRYVSESLTYMDKVLLEMGSRTGLDLNQVRHLKKEEIKKALSGKNLGKQASERIGFSVWIAENGKTEVYPGEKGREISKDFHKQYGDAIQIKGVKGCAGRATGPVRKVMELDQVKDVKEGEVIVCIQALPPFLPAMHKAVAIVADGHAAVTGHAAILAREVGIPCIVGAKISTQMLNDGDIVDVDAYNGIVNIIHKKEEPKNDFFIFEELPKCHMLAIEYALSGYINGYRENFGDGFKHAIAYCRQNNITLIFDRADFERVAKNIFKKIYEDPNTLQFLNNKIEIYSKDMIKLCEQYQDMDFSKLTDRELILFFDDFMKAYGELHFAGQPAGVMEYEHQYLSNHLIKKLKEKIEELDLARNEADLFSMMTTPTRPSYQQSEDLNLLKISEKIRQNEGMLQIFKSKQPNIISKVRRLYPALHKDIEKHHKEFCWLSYMWQGPCRKLDYYYELLIGLANDDCAERAKESNDHMKELEAEQRNILSMFDYKTRRLMEGAKDIVYLKGLRKDVLFLANHSMEKMQKEIMKRIGIVKPDFRLLLHDEIRSALMGADPKPLIKRRRKMHAIDYTEKGTEIFEGEDSASFIESLKIKTEIKEVHELKGMTAYPGEAIGIVKIINIPEDMDKMNEGDILVSQATQPDLIPAMKKAAAFVTDMGGITCHAAIVGREMKKPCVIGTKIATKVFKDGGRVFVDANNGVVRKV